MRQKMLGAALAITLVSLAAVGVFASQDAVSLLASPTDTATATSTATATVTGTPPATGTPSSTDTATATGTAAAATATPSTTGTPQATDTPEGTETAGPGEAPDGRDIKGIPTSNPSHGDGDVDGDGACDKGETVIKTTPSGIKVRVPCQTEKHGGAGSGAPDGGGE